MGLLKKIFGTDASAGSAGAASSQFQDGEATTEQVTPRNGPRRELVQVVLRDTMRGHGIPSDWIECRILSVVRRSKTSGMHVHLVVRDGHDRLLAYIPAFQRSFMTEIEKFEPRYAEWLLSLSWQFEQLTDASGPRMPDPSTWQSTTSSGEDEDVMQDLKALFAIRDAALAQPHLADTPDFEPTRPGFESSGGGPTGR
jgi:hypothetical protein